MAVHRVHLDKNFTALPNKFLQDPSLSLKAKGMLALMLTYPDNWDFSVAWLTKQSKDGRDAVSGAVNELISSGYIVRTPVRENGKFLDYEYDIYYSPITEKPNTENPYTVNPSTENPKQINTIDTKNYQTKKKEISKDISKESQKHRYGEYRHVLLTDKQVDSLKQKFGDKWLLWVQTLDEGIELKGYHYNNHYLAILRWAKKDDVMRSSQSGMNTDYLDNL